VALEGKKKSIESWRRETPGQVSDMERGWAYYSHKIGIAKAIIGQYGNAVCRARKENVNMQGKIEADL
jgi:hypothetical protein